MIDERYILMIHKHLRQELSEADQLLLKQWLDQAPTNHQAYQELEKAWLLSANYLADYTPDVDQGLTSLRKRIKDDQTPSLRLAHIKSPGFSFPAKIAAGLLFVLVALVVWNFWFRPANVLVVSTGPGEHKSIPLADGSTVVLNENSQLTYPSFFRDVRQVALSGEAFFEIAKDEQQTFTINTSKAKTEVLGTSFNLRAYEIENFTEVEVVEGLVRLADNQGQEPLELKKGHRGTYRHNEGTLRSDIPKTLNANFWNERWLRFKDHELAQAIDEINSRLNLDIQLKNTQLAKCSFTVGIELGHPENIVAIIADIYGASWDKTNDGRFIIQEGDCHFE